MFSKLVRWWKFFGFEIMIGLVILFLIIYAIIRWNKQGSYDRHFNKYINQYQPTKTNKRIIPISSRGEEICRQSLEKIFNKPFPKVRPNFLKNKIVRDMNLELDCFNSELRIGLEYNGRQHYEYIPYMHKNKEAFYNQKYRDELKKRMCKDNGIILIEVPYTVKNEHIYEYILNKIKKL